MYVCLCVSMPVCVSVCVILNGLMNFEDIDCYQSLYILKKKR